MIRKAVPHLEKAISLHPNYKNAYLLLGNAYNYLKEYPKSIQNYNQAINLDGNYVDAIQNLAISYRDNKQFDLAVQQFNQVQALAPGKMDFNENIAYTYEEAGKYYGSQGEHQRALTAFQNAHKYGTDKGKYLYFVGLAYGNLNNTAKAIESMEKALEATDKNDNKTYDVLARVIFHLTSFFTFCLTGMFNYDVFGQMKFLGKNIIIKYIFGSLLDCQLFPLALIST